MKKSFSYLKRLWYFLKKEKGKIVGFLILSALIIFISVLLPLIGANRIIYLSDNKYKLLFYTCLLLFIIRIIDAVVVYYRNYFANRIFRNVFKDMQNSLGSEILRITTSTFNREGSSVFVQRMNGDLSNISSGYGDFIYFFTDIIRNIGIFVVLFTLNYVFAIFVLIFTILFSIYQNKFSSTAIKKKKKVREGEEKTNSFLNELIRGSRDIKVLNSEKSFLDTLDKKVSELNDIRYESNDFQRLFNSLSEFLYGLYNFLVFVVIIVLVMENKLSIPVGMILINYSGNVMSLNRTISNMLNFIKTFNLSCERVFSIYDSVDFDKETWGDKHLDKIDGRIKFDNVSFKYDNKDVLKNMSFDIKAGETIAIVGKSGAGKTTILSLICKLFNIDSGHIYLDDNDIYELDKDSLRGNISIITQNPYIFNLSIRDNFKLIKSNLKEKEMITACKKACLHDFIKSLPNGYDTIVGEGGVTLSGGQRQRLAIARAFVQNTKLILFDEATSALDNETQANIKKTIDNMKGDFTILIVAHRLSTIKNADRILFISNGKVLDSGNHKYLFNNCKEYRQLYNSEIITKED